jgi:hypothetical protein
MEKIQKIVDSLPAEQQGPVARALTAEALKDSFSYFVRAAWPVIEQEPLIEGFCLDCLIAYLTAFGLGWVRDPELSKQRGHNVYRSHHRMIINMPPRMGKSTLCNVLFPAWVWAFSGGRDKFLFVSATDELAIRDSVRRRNLIQSDWYQKLFGDSFQLACDMNQKHHYVTTTGGESFAAYLGGVTGRGADYIIIDDPHKPLENPEIAINYCRTPAKGCILVVMHRVDVNDLSGVLLKGSTNCHG